MIPMDLCIVRAGGCTLAFSVSQVAGVAPFPARLPWPPPADGSLGWVAVTGADGRQDDSRTGMQVVDPVTYWQMAVGTDDAPDRGQDRPLFVVVLQGHTVALAVDSYRFGPEAIVPASGVLRGRGVYALAAIDGDYTIVYDMARLAPTQRVRAGAPAC
jgi:hypothetical protein